MKILNVKFESTGKADWLFAAETDDCLPDGQKNFSGVLTEHNGWKARAYIATSWGASAETRERAVENCLADAIMLLGEVELARLRRDAELERQREGIAGRSEKLNQMLANANAARSNIPVSFGGVLELGRDEVKEFVDLMVEGFERRDR